MTRDETRQRQDNDTHKARQEIRQKQDKRRQYDMT